MHIGEGLSLGVSLGHTGARCWEVTHLMTTAIALRPFDLCCPSLWDCPRQRILDGHCLPTENNLTVKPVKKTGKQETLSDPYSTPEGLAPFEQTFEPGLQFFFKICHISHRTSGAGQIVDKQAPCKLLGQNTR